MNMKKMILRILAAASAFALIAFVFSIANAFVGNPISKAIATNKIKKYVNEQYSDMELQLSKATYNFKDTNYYIRANSKDSKDTHFMLYYNKGNVSDSYESDVLSGWNTYMRLEEEFSKTVEPLIETKMPYKYEMLIATLDKDETITSDILPLDMEFDVHNIPLNANITLYIYYGDATWENVANVTLELDQLMQNNNIKISKYSVILRPETIDEAKEKRGESVGIYDFPRELLAQEDLASFMKDYFEEWEYKGNLEKSTEIKNAQ